MRFDVYAFRAPRDLAVDEVAARIEAWEADNGDPTHAPFEPSSDTAQFYREVEHDLRDLPGFEIVGDAEPHGGRGPVWLQTEPAPPAHIAAVRLPRGSESALREVLADVYGTAAKFDLLVFDAHSLTIHEPLAEMAAQAEATFWPSGAVRSIVVGGLALLAAVAAYVIGIPILSGVVIVVGAFMVGLVVLTLITEARRLGARGRTASEPSGSDRDAGGPAAGPGERPGE